MITVNGEGWLLVNGNKLTAAQNKRLNGYVRNWGHVPTTESGWHWVVSGNRLHGPSRPVERKSYAAANTKVRERAEMRHKGRFRAK